MLTFEEIYDFLNHNEYVNGIAVCKDPHEKIAILVHTTEPSVLHHLNEIRMPVDYADLDGFIMVKFKRPENG